MAWVSRAARGEIPGAIRDAGMYLSAFQKRRQVLAEPKSKIDCSKSIEPALRAANRTIGFTMTIDSADALAEVWNMTVSTRAFHSGLSKHERSALIDDFRSGKIRALVAAKVLDEGIDVPAADLAVIVATSRSPVQLVQRVGRVLRRKLNHEHARIVLMHVPDTADDPLTSEGALADMCAAAEAVRTFDHPSGMTALCEYLAPG
jgi:RNA polymerase primary sigma factor